MDTMEEGLTEQTNAGCEDVNVMISPYGNKDVVIPDISVTDMLFQAIDLNYEVIKDRSWVTDVSTGISYKFRDIRPMSRKIASALTRLGFKKGDVLFYSTNDAALIYLVNIGVWLCGGAIRACYQKDVKELYESRMREVSARFVLCDPETAPSVKWAASQLGWNVTLMSIGGEVEGALSIEGLIKNEDCSAFPKDVKINAKEDPLIILNTSGSTGTPKGVVHTYYNIASYFLNKGKPKKLERDTGSTFLANLRNCYSSVIFLSIDLILYGTSLLSISSIDMNSFVESALKHKPSEIIFYPHELQAFLQLVKTKKCDWCFIKCIHYIGSVLNYATAKTAEALLPKTKMSTAYAISETLGISFIVSDVQPGIKNLEGEGIVAGMKFKNLQGDIYLTSGLLRPGVMAKVMDPTSGLSLGRNVKGNLLIKTPFFMKGYLSGKNEEFSHGVDADGWFDTGDEAFFDEDGWLYIVGRTKFTFKYRAHWVSPTDVESIILNHPAVLSAVVVGVVHPETTAVAKAFVTLKPGCKVTEKDIKVHVSGQTAEHKHLHGGVVFVDSLPISPGGKIDRPALREKAIAEVSSTK